jgi:Mg/Co/Ni transporter MgtE
MHRLLLIALVLCTAVLAVQPAYARDGRLTPEQRDEVLRRMTPEQRQRMWEQMSPEQRGNVLRQLTPDQRDACAIA